MYPGHVLKLRKEQPNREDRQGPREFSGAEIVPGVVIHSFCLVFAYFYPFLFVLPMSFNLLLGY